jgi:phage repressor protein C with HTH and peptisase S24 domain
MSRISRGQNVDFAKVLGRIKEATGARTQVELATVLDIRQSSISDAKRRNSIPADWYIKLFKKYGLNPDWLSEGKGPHYLKTKEGYQAYDEPILSQTVQEDLEGYGDQLAANKIVTFYSMSGAATGKGGWKPSPAGEISIPKAFDRESLLVIKMDGSSMEPLIHKNAYIGMDREQTKILSGEIYGIQVPYEGLVIKRIFLEPEQGRLVLRSENERHSDQEFQYEEYADKIIGRVIWVMQEV